VLGCVAISVMCCSVWPSKCFFLRLTCCSVLQCVACKMQLTWCSVLHGIECVAHQIYWCSPNKRGIAVERGAWIHIVWYAMLTRSTRIGSACLKVPYITAKEPYITAKSPGVHEDEVLWDNKSTFKREPFRKRALYHRKRALYHRKRALHHRKRALCYHRRSPHHHKRALYISKRALYLLCLSMYIDGAWWRDVQRCDDKCTLHVNAS